MFRDILAASRTTTVLATAPTFAATVVKEVEVNPKLDAIENTTAGQRWATHSDDLEDAIVTRLVDRISDEGGKVRVDIESVELASSLQSAVGAAEPKPTGRVVVTTDNATVISRVYDFSVFFAQAGPFFLPGTDLTAIATDRGEYCDGMIAAFEDHVVQGLDQR